MAETSTRYLAIKSIACSNAPACTQGLPRALKGKVCPSEQTHSFRSSSMSDRLRNQYATDHLGWNSLDCSGRLRPRLSRIPLHPSRKSNGRRTNACHDRDSRPSFDSANTRRAGFSRRNCLACCWRQEKFLVRNYINARLRVGQRIALS